MVIIPIDEVPASKMLAKSKFPIKFLILNYQFKTNLT